MLLKITIPVTRFVRGENLRTGPLPGGILLDYILSSFLPGAVNILRVNLWHIRECLTPNSKQNPTNN